MPSSEPVASSIDVVAERIGGIDRTEVTLDPGVNVLTGRNATNRTSFLQSIMAAIGSDRPSLKGDAETGRVELSLDDEEYTRTLERHDGTVTFDGRPYLADPELADLFAFLLESNEARRAVRRGDELRELIMRPIDTDEIEAEIAAVGADKRDLDDRLDRLEELEGERPALEERRRAIEADIDAKRDRLAALREDLEAFDLTLDASQDRREDVEETISDLQDARAELESAEYELETERESKAELEAERDEIESELAAFDDVDSPERLEGRVQELRGRKRSLDTTLNELQSVIRFNEEHLEDGGLDLELEPEGEPNRGDESTESTGAGSADVTDRLLAETTDVVCWTCGSTVERDRIESTLERLRSLHQRTLGERNDLQDRIDDLAGRQRELRERTEERRELEDRLSSIEDELERRRLRIADLERDVTDLRTRVEDLEGETDALETTDYGEVIETHRELTQLEMELERLEDERTDVAEQLADIDAKLDDKDDLESRRDELTDELADLRTRVDRLEKNAVRAFNDHMDSILSILEYGNVERIWIERRETPVREGRRAVTKTAFDLHIVRTTDDGTTYEDRIDHLSESEREVTGLIFALAGFLVHDVHETVPFVLLDSLEAIDAARIADLVAYFEEYVDYLVVALLREDADALPESYTYVTEI
ncbi:AAA family ATPase [Natronorubrum sp. JWXQ-INN-674]|uniref:AAA family ATPase n=1 Tax=Natronorubrum halalkaliphilum TaxID=2691917 RepID=A0A6B0VGT6_9EURY|nr:archaea-specific SMC-related protein [Natronorubrum halalkaliphilum]MXV60750.1 AAA family ATPase [Natronorubrum halalkaliphilum]